MIDVSIQLAISRLYADYAAFLDERDYQRWVDLFIDMSSYILQPRENFDSGLPLATMRLESKGMILDRIYGITTTLYHAPYYQRHIVGPVRIEEGNEGFHVEANYVVIRTHTNAPSDILSAGRYIDRVVNQDNRFLFATKLCVFDTELIPNSVIYPI